MVEGEMKEMLEAIKFAHEHIKTKFLLNCVCKLLLVKKEVRTEGEREDEATLK
jgi:polyribonucleotide nucleotidyltransferase